MALFVDRTRALFARRRLEELDFRFGHRDFKVKEAIDLDKVKRWSKGLKEVEKRERYKEVSRAPSH
jgi:hypothetical protein